MLSMLALAGGDGSVSDTCSPALAVPLLPMEDPVALLAPLSLLVRQLLQADRPSATVSMPVKTTLGYSRFMVYSLWVIWGPPCGQGARDKPCAMLSKRREGVRRSRRRNERMSHIKQGDQRVAPALLCYCRGSKDWRGNTAHRSVAATTAATQSTSQSDTAAPR